jgi:ferrous iron transport protein B
LFFFPPNPSKRGFTPLKLPGFSALALTSGQLVVGSVVLAMFFPCIATFVVLLRELGVVNMPKSAGIMVAAALITGGILNLIL